MRCPRQAIVQFAAVSVAILVAAGCSPPSSETAWSVDGDSTNPPTTAAREDVVGSDPDPAPTTANDEPVVEEVDQATDVSFELWRERSAAVCAQFEPEVAELEQQLESASNPDEFVAVLKSATTLNERYIDELVAVEVPTDRSDHVEELYRRYARQGELAADMIYASSIGDAIEVLRLSMDLEQGGLELQTALLRMDLPGCV